MNEHTNTDAVREALSEALSAVGADDHSAQVRHPVRAQRAPYEPTLPRLPRSGRFSPAGICVFCNVAQHEHGKVCSRDDYSEWQRQLLEACKAGGPVKDPTTSYAEWRRKGGGKGIQDAGKLAALWRAECG